MTTIEFERDRIIDNLRKTEHRMEVIERHYRDAACCPSCGAGNSTEHGAEYRSLLSKQIQRAARLAVLEAKIAARPAHLRVCPAGKMRA